MSRLSAGGASLAIIASLCPGSPDGRGGDTRVDGLRIPSEVEVSWRLPDGDFAYWRGTITEIEYDVLARY